MGRKSSSKNHTPPPNVPGKTAVKAAPGLNPLLLGAVLVAVIGIGVFAFWRGNDSRVDPAPAATDAATTTTPETAKPLAKGAEPTPEIIAATEAQARLGPHIQMALPPIPFRGYAPPRPVEVVTAAFRFTAEHPEISSYIPCFCGCQQSGHKGNTDCFVRSRAETTPFRSRQVTRKKTSRYLFCFNGVLV